MRRRMIVLLVTGVIAALAVTVFAGFFWNDGRVLPPWGYGDSTLFTWAVEYQLSPPEQPTPSCYLKVWDGEWEIGRYMMAARTFEGVVYYTYSMTLPEGEEYSYRFKTFDDYTLAQFGPDVY